jgi:cyclopropane fatty-acyl-phospholipid synthase-like methyltransferase
VSLKDKRVLEVGCGDGRLSSFLVQKVGTLITKMSVSNFKHVGFRNNLKGFDSFEFLKYETRWDCRYYRIYSVRCHTA